MGPWAAHFYDNEWGRESLRRFCSCAVPFSLRLQPRKNSEKRWRKSWKFKPRRKPKEDITVFSCLCCFQLGTGMRMAQFAIPPYPCQEKWFSLNSHLLSKVFAETKLSSFLLLHSVGKSIKMSHYQYSNGMNFQNIFDGKIFKWDFKRFSNTLKFKV